MRLESSLERRCRDLARAAGLRLIKIKPFEGGMPDRALVHPKYPAVLVEFKRGENSRLRLRQQLRIAELRAEGYRVEVIDNVESFIELLSTYR